MASASTSEEKHVTAPIPQRSISPRSTTSDDSRSSSRSSSTARHHIQSSLDETSGEVLEILSRSNSPDERSSESSPSAVPDRRSSLNTEESPPTRTDNPQAKDQRFVNKHGRQTSRGLRERPGDESRSKSPHHKSHNSAPRTLTSVC